MIVVVDGRARPETEDEWRARQEKKLEMLHRFRELEQAAEKAAQRGTPYPRGVKVIERKRAAQKPRPPRRRPSTGRPVGGVRRAPERCVVCDFPLRIRSEGVKPGTRQHIAEGRCSRCDSAKRRRERGVRPIEEARACAVSNCRTCGCPLRSRGAPKVDGVRRHAGRGLCSACYRAEQRA